MTSFNFTFIFFSLLLSAFLFSNVAQASETNDTTYYYFSNGGISMIETPWIDGQKTFHIYNWQGEPIYSIENVLQSYSVITTFTFHENGAVNTAHTSTNPGASMYWYTSVIRFDQSNVPMNRIDKQEPAQTIEDSMGETFLWQAKKGQWIKQEVIQCQTVSRP